MAELLERTQTPPAPLVAAPESEPHRAPEGRTPASTEMPDRLARLDTLHGTMGNAVVQRVAVDSQGASRPADPGQGPGLDVVFVLKSSPLDPNKQQDYISDMTSFIRSALPGERLYEVDDLDGLLAGLFVIGADGERIRRLRIVGHGSHDKPHEPKYTHGGRVLTHDPGGRPIWIGADVVMAAARDPDNIRMMQEVMMKDAVVEFWGCSLGRYAKSGRAWAALFQRPFVAPTGNVVIDPWEFWMTLELAPRHPRGADKEKGTAASPQRLIRKRALTSAEAYGHGPLTSRAFEEFLLTRYRSLVNEGQISSIGDDRSMIITHMRQMFDAQQGAIHEVAISTSSGKVGPAQRAGWNRLWQTFNPWPIGAAVHATGGHPRLSVPDTSGAVKRPNPVLSERAWVHRYPAGKTEQIGPSAWVLWNFDVGRSALKEQHARQLDVIANAIAATARTGTVKISVEGYASASGSPDFNSRLSLARAHEVAAYLREHLGGRAIITPIGRGVRGARMPSGPEGLAGNRRVEVHIISQVRPAPPAREPLPSPELETSADWQVVGLARQAPGKALADYLPGYSIEGKLSWQLPPVPLGTDWLLIGDAEVGLKLEFTTRVPVTAAMAMKNGKWDYQIKLTLAHSITATGSLTEGKIGARFEDAPMRPELEVGVINLLKNPSLLKQEIAKDPSKLFKVVSIKFNVLEPIQVPRDGPLDLGQRIPELAGIKVKLAVQPKVVISLAPSPALIARMAASLGLRAGAAGPIAAGVIGGVGFTVLALYLIDRAHKRGERWADVVNFRRAYARRIAAEAADWRPGRGIASVRGWQEAREEMLKARYHGRPSATPEEARAAALMERTYTQEYEGWQSAEAAIRLLPVDQYDATMDALRKRFGTDYHPLLEAIFTRIGGALEDPIAPPANLQQL